MFLFFFYPELRDHHIYMKQPLTVQLSKHWAHLRFLQLEVSIRGLVILFLPSLTLRYETETDQRYHQ